MAFRAISKSKYTEIVDGASTDAEFSDEQIGCNDNLTLMYFLRRLRVEAESNTAENRNMHLPGLYRKAEESVRAYPFRLFSENQLASLKFFGTATVQAVKKHLWSVYPPPDPEDDELQEVRQYEAAEKAAKRASAKGLKPAVEKARKGGDLAEQVDPATGLRPAKRQKATEPRAYKPQVGTGNYAILVCLYVKMKQGVESLTKEELMKVAEDSQLAHKSMYGTGNKSSDLPGDKWYTGWSNAKRMVNNEPPLIIMYSNPKKVRLTDAGVRLGAEMYKDAVTRGNQPPLPGVDPDLDMQQPAANNAARVQSGAPPNASTVPPAAAVPFTAAAAAGPARKTQPAAAPFVGSGPAAPPPGVEVCDLISSDEDMDDQEPVRPPLNKSAPQAGPPRAPAPHPSRPGVLGRPPTAPAPSATAAAANTSVPTSNILKPAALNSRLGSTNPADLQTSNPAIKPLINPVPKAKPIPVTNPAPKQTGNPAPAPKAVSNPVPPAGPSAPRAGAPIPSLNPVRNNFFSRPTVSQDSEVMGGGLERQASGSAACGSQADAAGGGVTSSSSCGARNAWVLPALRDPSEAEVPPRLPPLKPGNRFSDEYKVVLLVDQREQFVNNKSTHRADNVQQHVTTLTERFQVSAELRHLPGGDALWVARDIHNPAREYVLDFIVERKQVEDLNSSIQDGRYNQQKYRLLHCGLQRRMYLVEGDIETAPQGVKACKTASMETNIFEGFTVIRTVGVHHTFQTYARLTAAITAYYAHCTADDEGGGGAGVSGGLESEAAAIANAGVLPAWDRWQSMMNRQTKLTVRIAWALVLTMVPGLGPLMAEAIVAKYPTPLSLWQAYKDVQQEAIAVGKDPRPAAAALVACLPTSTTRTVGKAVAANVYNTLFANGWILD